MVTNPTVQVTQNELVFSASDDKVSNNVVTKNQLVKKQGPIKTNDQPTLNTVVVSEENNQQKIDGDAGEPPAAQFPKTYIIQRGESLRKVSKRFYGTGSYWKELAKYNNLTIKETEKDGKNVFCSNLTRARINHSRIIFYLMRFI